MQLALTIAFSNFTEPGKDLSMLFTYMQLH